MVSGAEHARGPGLAVGRDCLGRYPATLRAPHPGDHEDEAAGKAPVVVVLAVLSGFGLHGDDAVHAARALRSTVQGFVSLEAAGGCGLPASLDLSLDRLVEGYIAALERAPERGRGSLPTSQEGRWVPLDDAVGTAGRRGGYRWTTRWVPLDDAVGTAGCRWRWWSSP
jgi:hypothetical protein